MAVEGIFSALNVRTALRLAEVRGVVLLAAAQNNVMVHSYSPREVKASVAGHGNADKRQMQVMVQALLKMTETPEPADAADALAVALCHLQAEQRRARFALPDLKGVSTAARRRSELATARAAANSTRMGRATSFDLPRIVTQR
jgi:crossover junction endodeoxyribonuclease RuvC